MNGVSNPWQVFLQSLGRLGGMLLALLADVLDRHRTPPQPAPLSFRPTLTKDSTMALGFEVAIRIPANPDPARVASQKFTLNVDDGPDQPSPVALGAAAVDFPLGTFRDKQKLKGALQYFNAAGAGGLPRVEEMVLDAALFPPQPDEFGFSAEEVEIPD